MKVNAHIGNGWDAVREMGECWEVVGRVRGREAGTNDEGDGVEKGSRC